MAWNPFAGPKPTTTTEDSTRVGIVGASRIGRYTVAGSLRRVDTIELAQDIPPGAPFVVAAGRLEFVVPVAGSFELRSVPMK